MNIESIAVTASIVVVCIVSAGMGSLFVPLSVADLAVKLREPLI